jgi:hypothetical protein
MTPFLFLFRAFWPLGSLERYPSSFSSHSLTHIQPASQANATVCQLELPGIIIILLLSIPIKAADLSE